MRRDMVKIGVTDDFRELEAVFEAFCENAPYVILNTGGIAQTLPIMVYPQSQCRFVELHGNTYVEQNPNKRVNGQLTEYALKARQGTLLLWIIRKSDNQWIGAIEEGEVYMKDWVLQTQHIEEAQAKRAAKQASVGGTPPPWMKEEPFSGGLG